MRVKFVESLNIKEVKVCGSDRLAYYAAHTANIAKLNYNDYMVYEEPITSEVVNVLKLNKNIRETDWLDKPIIEQTYIAYSKEVQDMLELPFDCVIDENKCLISENNELRSKVSRFDCVIDENKCLISENNELRSKVSRYDSLNFWGRVKFLFTRSA